MVSVPAIAFLLVLASFACTGLGMLTGAVGLRMRDVPIIANLTMAVLLIFCGVNVPLDKLPRLDARGRAGLPLTHAIAAARLVADGASLASVRTAIVDRVRARAGYLVAGFVLLRWFEVQGRRRERWTGHERRCRLVCSGFLINLKMLGTSSFFLLTSIVQPIIFATIAFYMFQSGGRPGTLLYAALGAGMMGVWSTTLFGSGGMIQWQRWQGTLELGVGAPPSMALVYLPFSLANAFTGMYALAATLVWGRSSSASRSIVHPWQFALALPATVHRARADGPRARVDVRPLPLRERAVEPARVPGLDRVGARVLDRDPARLDAADLLGAAAVLGHARDPPRRARRRRLAAARDGARCSALVYLAIATVTFRCSSTWRAPARRCH